MIKDLLESCYEHQFCQIDFDRNRTTDILHDTVTDGFFLSGSLLVHELQLKTLIKSIPDKVS